MPALDRNNNFDALRLVAALTVVVCHAWPLTGLTHPPALGGIPLFTLAVYVFFTLSGFLVGTSWVRDPRAVPFLIRRASRIFPALIVVVLLSVFVIGPLATTIPAGHYFASPATWGYLINLTLLAAYELPGVFVDHPRPVVNGALWTLGPEFTCYLGVLVVGVALVWLASSLRRPVSPLVSAAVFGAIAVLLGTLALTAPQSLGPSLPAVKAMVFFAVGAAIAHARPVRLPLIPAAVLAVVWLLGWLAAPDLAIVWAWIAMPYLMLALGSRSFHVVRRAGRFGDFSYGTYLWGFPVQQVVVQVAPGLPLWLDILVVVVITVAVAAASWHLVEARSLAFGRRGASRHRAPAPVPVAEPCPTLGGIPKPRSTTPRQ